MMTSTSLGDESDDDTSNNSNLCKKVASNGYLG